ncbi:MAG: uracil-DNA glycosylase [Clostridia bacterium]
MDKFNNNWDKIIEEEEKKPYFTALKTFVREEYRTKQCFPPAKQVFNALKLTAPEQVKVVILGQDPYHNAGQAHGLAFSVQEPTPPPPSLVNIFKAINYDFNTNYPPTGNLIPLAQQGVLLLNAVLTVRENEANSHKGVGWELFTDRIIEALNADDSPKVFMFWGNYAKQKSKLITNTNHLILTAVHPSPLSFYHGFLECKHFSKANDFLIAHGKTPIDYSIFAK